MGSSNTWSESENPFHFHQNFIFQGTTSKAKIHRSFILSTKIALEKQRSYWKSHKKLFEIWISSLDLALDFHFFQILPKKIFYLAFLFIFWKRFVLLKPATIPSALVAANIWCFWTMFRFSRSILGQKIDIFLNNLKITND